MRLVIDFGGSTIDVVEFFSPDSFRVLCSLESSEYQEKDLPSVLKAINKEGCSGYTSLVVTGGKTRFFPKFFFDTPIVVISEIEAIGRGGAWVSEKTEALVVSLGTGTCCVGVRGGKYTHVGGTGVGGGTLFGLSRALFGAGSFSEIDLRVRRGRPGFVDLSVADIVGGSLGRLPGTATAANFAKARRETPADDLAAGVARLVGQTIASVALFAARAEKFDTIVVGGKLSKMPAIMLPLQETAALYERELFVHPLASFLTAIGAGRASFAEE